MAKDPNLTSPMPDAADPSLLEQNPWAETWPRVGAEPRPRSQVLLFRAAILAIVVFTFWVLFSGLIERQQLPHLTFAGPPKLLSSNQAGNSIVRTQGTNLWSQVVVQQAGGASWQLVSEDDTTAAAAMLASDGLSVAYRSESPYHSIVFVDLKDNQRTAIADNSLAAEGKQLGISNDLAHCKWTPISWSPDGRRAAFFACTKDSKQRSYVTIAEVDYPIQKISVLSDTESLSSDERTVYWLGNDTVVTDNTTGGGEPPEPIQHPVP